MRTQDELIARIEATKGTDFLDWERLQYIRFSDFEHAKPFLKEGVTAKQWIPDDMTQIKDIMVDYMAFAWDKANGCRGLSTCRSIYHYVAWLWVDASEEAIVLSKTIKNYDYYGKPQLTQICKYLGIDVSQYDNGIRGNTEKECYSQL